MLASDQGGKVVQPFLEQLVEGEHHSGAPQRRRFRPTRQRRLHRFDGRRDFRSVGAVRAGKKARSKRATVA
jgi:hypothetical protein